jgi:UDP-GlcNAc:undecaprenyl-phosphate GlcNAc-1-phosphate transferase
MPEITVKDLITLILAFAGAMFIAWYFIPRVVKVASVRNLTDIPGLRKIHKKEIPTLGGIGIYAGFAFGFLLTIDGLMRGVSYFTVATLLLFFVGIKDDLISITPRNKLIAQLFAILIVIYFTDIRFTSFHGFMGITSIPTWLTYAVTIFVVIVIINSLNLIDGIDGLAASTGIIASVTFGIWFWLSGDLGYTIMAAALTGALAAFLHFNLSKGKNKIFMGDTGSLVIGFILAVMAIRFNEINNGMNIYHNLYSAPAVSIGILIVPLFDTLRVFTIRILRGSNPFVADNRHIHHMMLRAGYSHQRSTFYISLAHILIIILAFILVPIGILWLSVLLLLGCTLLTGLVYVLVYKNCTGAKVIVNCKESDIIRNLTFFQWAMRQKVWNSQTPDLEPQPLLKL